MDFFFFKKLITPTVIQVIFWIWLAGIWLGALGSGIALMSQGGFLILVGLIEFLLIGVLGSIFARVSCEVVIVFFQIHAELVAMRTGTHPGTAPASRWRRPRRRRRESPLSADVFVPEFWVLADKVRHHLNALGVLKIDHLDPLRAH